MKRLRHQWNLLCIILCFIGLQIQAQNTWIVSNDPGFEVADFDTIQNAVDAASPGDKIYVYGSGTPYQDFHLDKKLHVIGSGYWKAQNDIDDLILNDATVIERVFFDPGSDSSIVEGFAMESCNIDAHHVIVRYNRFCCKTSQGPGGNAGQVHLFNFPIGAMIYGNYISYRIDGAGSGINVFNNIFGIPVGGSSGWTTNSGCTDCVLQNNIMVVGSFSSFSNCVFRNNIVASGSCILTNTIYEHNIFVADEVSINGIPMDSLGNGNVDSVDINTVWDLSNPSPDGKYQLVGNSMSNPAIEGGAGGEDCGIFGGATPYRVSGIVKVPAIYKILIPLAGDTTNMLNIKIKAN